MKRCRKPLRFILAFYLMVVLAACSSTAPKNPAPKVHYLEQDAINAISLHLEDEANTALNAALSWYQSLDDLEGQWRVRYTIASIAFAKDDRAATGKQVDSLEQLAKQIDSSLIDYKTKLLLGQIRHEDQYFTDALASASSNTQRAVANTYLGNTVLAISILDGSGSPGDRAFVYYQYAKSRSGQIHSGNTQSDNEGIAEQYFRYSLQAYKLAEDPRGVADALLSIARIKAENHELDAANDFGRRAINALEAAGQAGRADAVKSWLSTL